MTSPTSFRLTKEILSDLETLAKQENKKRNKLVREILSTEVKKRLNTK